MSEPTQNQGRFEGSAADLEALVGPNPDRYERLLRVAVRAFGASAAVIECLHANRVKRVVSVGELGDGGRSLGDVYREIESAEETRVIELESTGHSEERRYDHCAGVPICLPSGQTVGVLCIFGDRLDEWGERERVDVVEIGRSVADALEVQRISGAFRRTNEELRALISASPVAILTFDREGVVERWSRSAEELFGYERAEVVGERVPFAQEESDPEFEELRERVLAGDRIRGREIERPTKTGELRAVSLSAAPVHGPDGDVQKGIAILEDVTERRRRERALEASEERFRRVFEQAGIGIALLGTNGRLQKANPALSEMLEYPQGELAGMDFVEITHPEDVEEDVERYQELFEGERDKYQLEKRYLTNTGDVIWGRLTVSAVRDRQSEVEYILGMVEDVTAQKQAERKLVFRAQHDSLTGLVNRETFERSLRRRLEKAEQTEDYGYAVLFMDLDELKEVNDRLGHGAGDELLAEVAERLEELLRASDSVARIGGDEFAVLFKHVGSTEEAVHVAERLQAGLAAPTTIEQEVLYPSVSIGIAVGDETYDTPSEILRDADSAMYAGKDLGGGRIAVSNDLGAGRAERTRALGSDVRRALDADELELRYRPVVQLENGAIGGAFVEPYWNHPDRGWLGPDQLRRAAESGGASPELEHWVIGQVSRQIERWRDHSDVEIPPLFTPCGSEFCARPSFVEALGDIGAESAARNKITVGLPETELAGERRTDVDILEEYRDLGFGVGVDRYGCGQMSLRLFETPQFEVIVLDPSIIDESPSEGQNAPALRSTFGAAEEFDQTVVASGIETEVQRRGLASIGCEWGTGPALSDLFTPGELRERYDGAGPW